MWRWEVGADRIEASTRFRAFCNLAARNPIELATLWATGWVGASYEFMDKRWLEPLAFGRMVRTRRAARFQGMSQMEKPRGNVEAVRALGTVRAPKANLGRTFANLLSNTLKFMVPGVRPHARLVAEERGTRVRFRVEDNGIGVPCEPASGLSIMQKCAQRMGGMVSAESEPGRGSRFWIGLPKASPEAAA